jgi:hypothetical protein
VAGETGTTADETGTAGGDQSVEHYERTSDPNVEREQRFERDQEGDVVRDETYERPRSNS